MDPVKPSSSSDIHSTQEPPATDQQVRSSDGYTVRREQIASAGLVARFTSWVSSVVRGMTGHSAEVHAVPATATEASVTAAVSSQLALNAEDAQSKRLPEVPAQCSVQELREQIKSRAQFLQTAADALVLQRRPNATLEAVVLHRWIEQLHQLKVNESQLQQSLEAVRLCTAQYNSCFPAAVAGQEDLLTVSLDVLDRGIQAAIEQQGNMPALFAKGVAVRIASLRDQYSALAAQRHSGKAVEQLLPAAEELLALCIWTGSLSQEQALPLMHGIQQARMQHMQDKRTWLSGLQEQDLSALLNHDARKLRTYQQRLTPENLQQPGQTDKIFAQLITRLGRLPKDDRLLALEQQALQFARRNHGLMGELIEASNAVLSTVDLHSAGQQGCEWLKQQAAVVRAAFGKPDTALAQMQVMGVQLSTLAGLLNDAESKGGMRHTAGFENAWRQIAAVQAVLGLLARPVVVDLLPDAERRRLDPDASDWVQSAAQITQRLKLPITEEQLAAHPEAARLLRQLTTMLIRHEAYTLGHTVTNSDRAQRERLIKVGQVLLEMCAAVANYPDRHDLHQEVNARVAMWRQRFKELEENDGVEKKSASFIRLARADEAFLIQWAELVERHGEIRQKAQELELGRGVVRHIELMDTLCVSAAAGEIDALDALEAQTQAVQEHLQHVSKHTQNQYLATLLEQVDVVKWMQEIGDEEVENLMPWLYPLQPDVLEEAGELLGEQADTLESQRYNIVLLLSDLQDAITKQTTNWRGRPPHTDTARNLLLLRDNINFLVERLKLFEM